MIAVLAAGVIPLACRDDPSRVTAPAQPLVDPRSIRTNADFEPVSGGEGSLDVPNLYSPSATVSGPYFATKTLVRATVSGNITVDYSPYWATGYSTNPAPGSYGPGGYVINPQLDCGANAYVGSTSAMGGETWQAGCGQSGSTSGYFYAAGQTSFNRAASAPSSDCYNPATGTGP